MASPDVSERLFSTARALSAGARDARAPEVSSFRWCGPEVVPRRGDPPARGGFFPPPGEGPDVGVPVRPPGTPLSVGGAGDLHVQVVDADGLRAGRGLGLVDLHLQAAG